MHYIQHLSLSGFYLRCLTSATEERPAAVVRDRMVIDASAAALRAGIRTGMAQRQAMTYAPELLTIPWNEEACRKTQETFLDVCVNYTGVIEPGEQHEAFLDLTGHPDPLGTGAQVAESVRSKIGLPLRWGMARSKWMARLDAQLDGGGIALTDPESFLAELPVSALLPVEKAHLDRLEFMGFRTLAQVRQLSLRELTDQFGEAGHIVYKAVRGGCIDLVKPVYPPDSITEQIYFAGALESQELFYGALQLVSERLGEELSKRELQGQDVLVAVDLEESGVKRFRRRFSKPIHNTLGVFSALKIMLLDRIGAPITGLRVTLAYLTKVKTVQRALVSNAPAERRLGADLTLRHLRKAFGDGVVKLASEIEEPRRKRVLRAWKDAIGW